MIKTLASYLVVCGFRYDALAKNVKFNMKCETEKFQAAWSLRLRS